MQRARSTGVDLAFQSVVVDARAAPDPVRGLAAVERRIDAAVGVIADPHFARTQEDRRVDRFHAEGHGRRAFGFRHCGVRDILAGISSAISNTLRPAPKVAQIWFTAAPPFRNWRPSAGHLARIGRHPAPSRRDCRRRRRRCRPLDRRFVLGLPGGEPFDDLFQPPRAPGSGQLRDCARQARPPRRRRRASIRDGRETWKAAGDSHKNPAVSR